jgi:hypothetical protein
MARTLFALLCLLLPAIALADDSMGRSIPYQKLYEPLNAVHQADPQGIVKSSLRAEPAAGTRSLPSDLKIELRSGATTEPVAPDDEGRFVLPMHADWASGNATLWINHPKSQVVIVEIFTMRTPTSTHLEYGQLMESLQVMQRIQAQHAQIAGLMTDKPQGVELAFDPGTPQTVVIGASAKVTTWNTDEQGHVRIPFDQAVATTTPVVLSAVPRELQPYAH